MKKLHKILYSLFGFFVCGFGHTGARADGTACGEFIQENGYTTLKVDSSADVENNPGGSGCAGTVWILYKNSKDKINIPSSAQNYCDGNQCITVSSGNFSSGCVTYKGNTSFCGLYEVQVTSNYGCTQGEAYTSSGCKAASSCDVGRHPCDNRRYHKSTCNNGCAPGFFYDSATSVCTQCPTYNIEIAGKDGTAFETDVSGSTASCYATNDATVNNCYASNVTNGRTKDGHSYTITNGACFYGSY